MLIVGFCLVVGLATIFARLKDVKEMKKDVDFELNNKEYQKYDYSKVLRVIYTIILLFGFGSAAYSAIKGDLETCAMGLIIGLIMISEILTLPYKYVLYYNDNRFIAAGKVSKYTNIKDFEELKFVKIGFIRAVLHNGDHIPLSRKAYEIVKEQKAKRKDKK